MSSVIPFTVCPEHDQMLAPLLDVSAKNGDDFMLVNVDSHSDMDMFKGDLNIGNFITKALGESLFSDCVWIKGEHSWDFDDGRREFKIWPNPVAPGFVCDLEDVCYFLTDTFRTDPPPWARAVTFTTISESALPTARLPDERWVLSVDCDYFSTNNPLKKELEIEMRSVDAGLFAEFERRFEMVKTNQDWISLRDDLKSRGLLDKFLEILFMIQTEKIFTDDEIDQKIDRVFGFLSERLDPETCLGIFLCESHSSGFLPTEKAEKISRSLISRILKDYGMRLEVRLDNWHG